VTTFRDLTLTRQTLWVNSVINHGLFETTLARASQTAQSDQAFHAAEAGHHAPPRVENREGMASATRAGLQSPTRLRWVQLRTADNLARAPILASRRFWRRRAFQHVCVTGVCKVEKVVRDVLAKVCLRWQLDEL
jgi:hypothetical protein